MEEDARLVCHEREVGDATEGSIRDENDCIRNAGIGDKTIFVFVYAI
jgi:hypothetical protein